MKYLVTMELGQPLPESPQGLLHHVEDVVIPSHEMLLKLEKEGKILAGGDMSGRRGSVLILEADSNAEVSQILATMPLWATQ
ncbi:muconolactone Delta-isomerase family protein, partial [Arthrospira platensis SPKY1]|nr:muconolactone Delta-isomerase family protein [Arthrospira platensis SPKY1]